ncbi:Short-chain Dehydrogenase/Reductase (SDR) [Abortiporus biennis]
MSNQLVWLITGTSSGFGRDLTLAALRRGDKVIATGRAKSINRLADLKAAGADVLELDVTAPLEDLRQIAKQAISLHGRIDVVVNNAGYMEVAMLEEATPEETYAQFNTNVFGPLNINRAFLPYMRQRKSGTIVWLGSIGGWRGGSNIGLYIGTKHAVRLSESLHQEISPLGLRSICFEPGFFRTEFLADGNRGDIKSRIPDYQQLADSTVATYRAYNGKQPGDPKKAVEVIIDVVKGEGFAKDKKSPTVVALGRGFICVEHCIFIVDKNALRGLTISITVVSTNHIFRCVEKKGLDFMKFNAFHNQGTCSLPVSSLLCPSLVNFLIDYHILVD